MKTSHTGTRVRLRDSDGFSHEFTAFWLREASASPEHRDPRTGHKLKDGDQIPIDVAIESAEQANGTLSVRFSDGHQADYPLSKLRAAAEHPYTQELLGEKKFWDANLSPFPRHSLPELQRKPAALRNMLDDIAKLGFVLVDGIPAELDGMARFIELLGYMRITNNGGIEDIKAVGAGKVYDLSMTPRALEPHCDNPYRIPQPGYVLLHCLANDAQGGESGITDGFFVAEKMRREHPDLFHALCTVPVRFRYADDQAILEHTSPFIDVDPDGRVTHVRFHGRCDQVAAIDPDRLDVFFRARRKYSELIGADDIQLRFKMQPGEMFMVDNYRIIHSRKAFRLETGSRHMRQAYIDRDVVSSRQKTLHRSLDAKPWRPRE
jgi:gamma-butyrobetaine dioxygenase